MNQDLVTVIERKVKYTGNEVLYVCQLIEKTEEHRVLFHKIQKPFTISLGTTDMRLTKGDETVGYYWLNRPYNVYIWHSSQGEYLGAYFNLVKDTLFTEDEVIFKDLIIDVVVLPTGQSIILDENELPQELPQFEEGRVQQALTNLLKEIKYLLPILVQQTDTYRKKL